jgi:hypothetical protein
MEVLYATREPEKSAVIASYVSKLPIWPAYYLSLRVVLVIMNCQK